MNKVLVFSILCLFFFAFDGQGASFQYLSSREKSASFAAADRKAADEYDKVRAARTSAERLRSHIQIYLKRQSKKNSKVIENSFRRYQQALKTIHKTPLEMPNLNGSLENYLRSLQTQSKAIRDQGSEILKVRKIFASLTTFLKQRLHFGEVEVESDLRRHFTAKQANGKVRGTSYLENLSRFAGSVWTTRRGEISFSQVSDWIRSFLSESS